MPYRIDWASTAEKLSLLELARRVYRLRSAQTLRLLRYDLLFQHALVLSAACGGENALERREPRCCARSRGSALRAVPDSTFTVATACQHERAALDAEASSTAEGLRTPLAFVSFAIVANELQIGWFGVHPDHRRCGLASAILQRLALEGERVGVERLSYRFFAPERHCPRALAKLYSSLGYARSGELFIKTLPPHRERMTA
ncbi:MAG: GNAT family N-acetyltransferase [Myxococcota bacterium]|jgi:GNAT superfamily N-acetyltransferase|nr:GNAT family N-acetyltransferase [Myxococcota bacterium]